MKSLHVVALTIFLLLANFQSFSQNSVGIGTENSNNNAVLELVSPTNNQGLLVPRVTTAQRTDVNFTNNLSLTDNGLLVFDSDEKKFYYWQDSQWQPIKSGVDLTTGSGVSIVDGQIVNTGDADADPANEIQDLSLTGNTLTITNNPTATSIDLSPFSGTNTDNQTLSFTSSTLSITGGNSVDISGLYAAGTGISIASGIITNTGDTDPTDDFSGSFLDLTNVPVNLDTDATDDFDGAFTSLTGIPAGISDGDDINDADADPTNELQDLSISKATLSLTGDATPVDLSVFLQDLTITGDLLEISGDATGVDLSGYMDNTDAQDLTLDGATNTLSLTGDATSVDLSGYVNTDNQSLSRTGNTLSLTNGGSVAINDQVAFKAVMTADQNITTGGGLQLLFGGADYDITKSYDPATSTFKAPVDGIYNFSGVITLLIDTGSDSQLYVVVDGAQQAQVINIKSTFNTDSFPFSVDLSLLAGQSVQLFIAALKPGTAIGNGGGKFTNESFWSGKLLVNLSK